MNDLISRQAAIDANCVDWCNRKHSECPYFDNVGTNEQVCDGCYTVLVLKDLPPAQPEQKSGEWIYDGVKRICPFCKDFIVTGRSIVNYCWNCGARLKERSKDAES